MSGKVYRTINPANGEVLQEIPGIDDAGAQALLDRAHARYLTWRETPIPGKAALFTTMAGLVEKAIPEIARRITLEMGKPLAQSEGEVGMVVEMFTYYAERGAELLKDRVVEVRGFSKAVIRREPTGVVLGIEPWNGPAYQAMRPTVPNLMLGNTVIVKPSSLSAWSTTMFDDLFADAGFPEGVYQTALVSADQASTLIADPRVRAISLTGSDAVGAEIGRQAGALIKPVTLELGGSDAFIVLDSADVPAAAAFAANLRCFMSGQVCAGPKRFIVTEGAADTFIKVATEAFANQVVGDGLDPKTTLGPVSSVEAAAELQEQLDDAIAKGATVLVPGGWRGGPGAFFDPPLLTDITPDMRIWSEEVFGPIGVIYRVKDNDAAVELANSSRYGLGGTVFGETEEALEVAKRLDTGGVGINTFLGAPIEIPFGGVKASGLGRELGETGIDQFANIKTYGIA